MTCKTVDLLVDGHGRPMALLYDNGVGGRGSTYVDGKTFLEIGEICERTYQGAVRSDFLKAREALALAGGLPLGPQTVILKHFTKEWAYAFTKEQLAEVVRQGGWMPAGDVVEQDKAMRAALSKLTSRGALRSRRERGNTWYEVNF